MRRRTRTTGAAGLVAGLLVLPAAARAADLTVTLEPREPTVGDRVEAVLELSAEPAEVAGEPRFPVWEGRWGGAEVLEAGPVVRLRKDGGGGLRFRQRLVLVAFRTGAVELPPKRIALPGPAATAELWTPAGLALDVASVLPPGEDRLEPRLPAAPEPLPLGGAFWWTLASLSGLAVGAVVLARRGGSRGESARPRTAAEALEDGLVAAARAPSAAEGHVALSLALRRFLGHALGFPAAESTTDEIRRQLRSRRLPPAVAARSHEVLRACDRVKFGREPVAPPALEARIEAAREIAGAVAAHLRPPAATAEGEEAA